MSEGLLFSEGHIGRHTIRNRIVMLPMATNLATDTGGVTKEIVDYYAERAKGGAGLIIIENTGVDFPGGKSGAIQLRADLITLAPGLSRLAAAIHFYGAKALIQFQHAGTSTNIQNTLGNMPVGASATYDADGHMLTREVSVQEIKEITEKFVRSACFAESAGIDGVEIHAAHSYLLAGFLSPLANQRKDEYGGSLANRSRIVIEIVKAVRAATGKNFIVGVRMNGLDVEEGGLTLDEAKQIAVWLEEASADMLDISTGYRVHSSNLSQYTPEGWRVYMAAEIKKAVNIPVVTSGAIRDFDYMEEILRAEQADFIGLGRSLLADPWLPRKLARGEKADIRPCITCNEGCVNNRMVHGRRSVQCAVNTDAGREGSPNFLARKTDSPRKVAVIGAGIAGSVAAIEASCCGHQVVVWEKSDKIGGVLPLAARPHGKKALNTYLTYLQHCLSKEKIDIRYNQEGTYENITAFAPDSLIVATGSEPLSLYGVQGLDRPGVFSSLQVLEQKREEIQNKNIVIIGGGSVGCETAHWLADGNNITVVEMTDTPAIDMQKMNRQDLLGKLSALHVNIRLKSRVAAVEERVVKLQTEDSPIELPWDMVVLAVGFKPLVPDWLGDIDRTKTECHIIGDAHHTANIMQAVHKAVAVARSL